MQILEEAPATEPPTYDFSGMTDLDLVHLQKETRDSPFPEDKEFLNAILKELARRQHSHEASPDNDHPPAGQPMT